MRIAAVCTAYHEADIIGWTVRHLAAEGIDEILISVPEGDDETIAEAHRFIPNSSIGTQEIWVGKEEFHDQPKLINAMADFAARRLDCDWIIPFDADEFFYSPIRPETIRETLEQLPDYVRAIEVPKYHQHDWWWSEPMPSGMPKMVYRYDPEVRVGPGNHTLTGLAEDAVILKNGLLLREYQYRGFDHFVRKVAERKATIDPAFGPEMGWHILQHAGKSEAELHKAYDEIMDFERCIWAPLPTRLEIPEYVENWGSLGELRDLMSVTPCDIAGHLHRLSEIVQETQADHVIECGTNTGMSTIAFLSTGAEVYSCDYAPLTTVRPEVKAAPNWHPTISDDIAWEVPVLGPHPVIFIDTSHTYHHSLAELRKFWPMVADGGCMIWHDTTTCPEQQRAIRHWLHTIEAQPRIEHHAHDNGLTVFWKES